MHFLPLKRKVIAVPILHPHVVVATIKLVPSLVRLPIIHRFLVSLVLVTVPFLAPISSISVAPMPVTSISSTIVFDPLASLDSRGKEILFLKDAPPFISTFEFKRSSHYVPLTWSQQQNRDFHTRRALERFKATVHMDEEVPPTQASTLHVGNYFHPLSDTNGEEDVRRIVTTLPPPIISSLPVSAR